MSNGHFRTLCYLGVNSGSVAHMTKGKFSVEFSVVPFLVEELQGKKCAQGFEPASMEAQHSQIDISQGICSEKKTLGGTECGPIEQKSKWK